MRVRFAWQLTVGCGLLLASLVGMSACSSDDSSGEGTGPAPDAAVDSGSGGSGGGSVDGGGGSALDGGGGEAAVQDGGADVAQDGGGQDTGTDATVDSGSDGSTEDANPDSATDSGSDATPDATADAGTIKPVHKWKIEVVDAKGDVGEYASLVLAGPQHPMISYYNNQRGVLRFAEKSSSAWSLSDAVTGNVGKFSQLARGSGGTLYAVYRDDRQHGLYLATRRGSTWKTEAIEMGRFIGWDASIALRSQRANTVIHVAYYDSNKGDLRYAVRSGSKWKTSLLDGQNEDVGWYTSIAVDAKGDAHITYIAKEDSTLRYMVHTSQGWTKEKLPDTSVGDTQSLALDPQGRPCVAYTHDKGITSAKPTLWFAIREGGQWKTQLVDGHDDQTGQFSSIAFDSKGHAHISYLGAGTLRHAWFDGSSWKVELVDDDGIVGRYTSIAIDSNDKVHIAYQDVKNKRLKYAVQQ